MRRIVVASVALAFLLGYGSVIASLTAGARTVAATRVPRRRAKLTDDSTLPTRERLGAAAGRAEAKATDLSAGTRTVVVKRMPRRREKPIDLSSQPDEAKLIYCRILVRQAMSNRVLDPREISNLYLFASTIGLDPESRTAVRFLPTCRAAAPALMAPLVACRLEPAVAPVACCPSLARRRPPLQPAGAP